MSGCFGLPYSQQPLPVSFEYSSTRYKLVKSALRTALAMPEASCQRQNEERFQALLELYHSRFVYRCESIRFGGRFHTARNYCYLLERIWGFVSSHYTKFLIIIVIISIITYLLTVVSPLSRQHELASCLIYARPLRPDRWLVGARFVDSWRPFSGARLGAFFIEPDFLKTM